MSAIIATSTRTTNPQFSSELESFMKISPCVSDDDPADVTERQNFFNFIQSGKSKERLILNFTAIMQEKLEFLYKIQRSKVRARVKFFF